MSGFVGLAFDILILIALGATIFHALRLSKQFEKMQADRRAFEQLIAALNVASSRAEAAIRVLREAASEGGETLQERINKGRALADELEIIIQAGDSMANRLTETAAKGRQVFQPEEPQTLAAPAKSTEPRSRAEKELLDALKARQQT